MEAKNPLKLEAEVEDVETGAALQVKVVLLPQKIRACLKKMPNRSPKEDRVFHASSLGSRGETRIHLCCAEPKVVMISAILIGLIVGLIAKLLIPGRDPGGIIVTILLGIAGGVIAAWLGRAIGWYEPGQPAGIIGSIVGAVVLLLIYRFFQKTPPTVQR